MQLSTKPIPRWASISGWVFGVFFALGGITEISGGAPVSGIACFAISGFLIPLIRAKVYGLTGIDIPMWARGISIFVLFLIVVSSKESSEPQPASVTKTVAEENVADSVSSLADEEKEKVVDPVSDITFQEVYDKFSVKSNLTDLQKDHFWKDYEGKCVEWTGKLEYLDSGFLGGIDIGFDHGEALFTYDVLVSAPDSVKETALGWSMESVHTYRATLTGYGGAILPISADWGCE